MTASLDDVVTELRGLRSDSAIRNELLSKQEVHLRDIKDKLIVVATSSDIQMICGEQIQLREDYRIDRKLMGTIFIKALGIVSGISTAIMTIIIYIFRG
jgi:hypothetical protein